MSANSQTTFALFKVTGFRPTEFATIIRTLCGSLFVLYLTFRSNAIGLVVLARESDRKTNGVEELLLVFLESFTSSGESPRIV